MELTDPLIIKYRDILLKKGRLELLEVLVPDRAVIDLIASMAGANAADALERLANLAEGKLDREAATQAYAELTGVYDERLAVRSLARHVAMWYLRLAQELGVIELG